MTFREADNPRGLHGAGLPRELTAAMEEDHRRDCLDAEPAAKLRYASVSTFASRARGSSCRAAASNAGAIIRQGPHQGAQKSTSMGISLFSECRRKRSALSRETGFAAKSFDLHLPQTARSVCARRAAGRRFTASQLGQTMFSVVDKRDLFRPVR